MEESKHIEKGFNQGYELAKLNPQMARKLSMGFEDKTHPYADAFIKGISELVKEKNYQQVKSRSHKNIDISKYSFPNKILNKEKDKEMGDLDK